MFIVQMSRPTHGVFPMKWRPPLILGARPFILRVLSLSPRMSRRSQSTEPAPLRSWRDLFSKHVRLVRKGMDFRLVLMDPASAAAEKARRMKAKSDAKAKPAKPKSRASQGLAPERLALMRRELRALLKRHEQARSLARHLAYFERALHKSEERAFDEVPVDVMRKALIQIEFLVSNWSQIGLAELRSRLSIAISDREGEVQGAESVHDMRHVKGGTAISVQDATVSQFMEMQQSWMQPAPGGAPLTPREDKPASDNAG